MSQAAVTFKQVIKMQKCDFSSARWGLQKITLGAIAVESAIFVCAFMKLLLSCTCIDGMQKGVRGV